MNQGRRFSGGALDLGFAAAEMLVVVGILALTAVFLAPWAIWSIAAMNLLSAEQGQ